MKRSTKAPRRTHRGLPWLPALLVVAAVALAAAPALPAAGEAPQDEVEKREVVVVTKTQDEGAPKVFVHALGGGYLGVQLTALTPELRAHFGVPEDRGVMVARVAEDSPAARAGLQVGDVVTGIEGEAVETPWDLSLAVRGKEAGETASLEVWRDGRGLDFDVTLEERERERIDLGGLHWQDSGDGPHVLRLRERLVPDGPPTLFFDSEAMERLGESIENLDWPRLNRRLGERNRELEERLEALEERLEELEEALRSSER